MRRLANTAAEQGLVELTGMARPDDLGVTRVFRRAALRPSAEITDGWSASGPPPGGNDLDPDLDADLDLDLI